MGFLVSGRMLCGLGLEALALIERIIQLGKGVGNLASRNIELEPVRQGWIGILPAGERRNFDRIVGDERRLLEFRLDGFFEDLVQNIDE